jgi:ribonuclease HI
MTIKMKSSTKFYVVWHGRIPGIYDTWEDCKKQVHRFSNARFKSFEKREDAVAAYNINYKPKTRSKWISNINKLIYR